MSKHKVWELLQHLFNSSQLVPTICSMKCLKEALLQQLGTNMRFSRDVNLPDNMPSAVEGENYPNSQLTSSGGIYSSGVAAQDSVSKGDNVSDNLIATENKMDQKVEMRQNLTELEGSVQAAGDNGFTIDSVE
ncbi:cell division cycle 5-like protein [Prunus yedoensis var. nudiflora]|uniref:Cell division cycle 5-like protein n=1 Tax=Prunus yedoensis var. nudiflora TaxID=2094558 RepID=A0A314XQZ5_PRUYE|nr:cell division cycle 5-like protein [Prunus yedoensis var. nudiflora]